MALIKCRECGNEVSNKAKNCPQCGAQVKRNDFGCGSILAVVFIIVLFAAIFGEEDSAAPTSATVDDDKPEVSEKPCDSDACLSDRFMIDASVACKPYIQKLSKYQYEWLDGWTMPTFSRYSVSREGDVAITYFGDALKFQNGFGAWSNIIYMCKYNTSTGLVMDYMAEEGRL